jgi:anti-sigma regulatory factor (Ser/Thr protein kinase)
MTRKLAFKSDPAALAAVRAELRRFLNEARCPAGLASRVILALTEASTNITRHTYVGDHTRTIRLACETARRKIRFRLRDYGPRLDPRKIRPRTAHQLKPGGLGIVLMHKTFDTIRLVNHPRGNELVMEFTVSDAN